MIKRKIQREKKVKRVFAILLAIIFLCLASCACHMEKNITVIVREESSGTREAFDKVISKNGISLKGNITKDAIIHNKTGLVLSSVASDENAIGYVSIGSLNDSVKAVEINGIMPSNETVLNGSYKIQRPFVIMSSKKVPLTLRTEDFLKYLKSDLAKTHTEASGTIFIEDAQKRANEGSEPIEILTYEKQNSLPNGGKIVIRGSTSMEKFINSAIKGYAELYDVDANDIFDIELQGSSIGKATVENDMTGNVIGLSSASVNEKDIESFYVCLDAIAVIVNKNTQITNLTIEQLYDIFTGKIKGLSEIQ